MRTLRVAQFTLLGVSVALVGYLAVLALRPSATPPAPFQWFGMPRNSPTVAIVVITVVLLCAVSYLIRRNRASATVPVVIVVGLLGASFVLGFASYVLCRGDSGITFFTPFEWTTSLVKGGAEERVITLGGDEQACPAGPPVALTVARLLVLGAFSVGVIGVAAAAFRLQADRIRAWLSRKVTAVVGVDEAGVSMVTAIARESTQHGAVVLLTTAPDGAVAQECRGKGARVVQVDFDHPETMGTKRFWRKVERLYLLSPDPSTNLGRLRVIGELLGGAAVGRRIPVIVRIDDPWLAIAWRAEQFGGSDTSWAGDAVGTYEVTARRLLDQITAVGTITQVIVCGRLGRDGRQGGAVGDARRQVHSALHRAGVLSGAARALEAAQRAIASRSSTRDVQRCTARNSAGDTSPNTTSRTSSACPGAAARNTARP